MNELKPLYIIKAGGFGRKADWFFKAVAKQHRRAA